MGKSLALKQDRIEIRTNYEVKSLIQKAADAVGVTLTSFVTQQAYEAAKKVLAERESLMLDDRERDQFLALVDSPPKANKALKSLFKKSA